MPLHPFLSFSEILSIILGYFDFNFKVGLTSVRERFCRCFFAFDNILWADCCFGFLDPFPFDFFDGLCIFNSLRSVVPSP